MKSNPILVLRGTVEAVEDRSFTSKTDGKVIKTKYAYIRQDDCMTLAEVQIKPVTVPIVKGDKFDDEVEAKTVKDMKGNVRIAYVFVLDDEQAKAVEQNGKKVNK